jgi:hypothetical protein
MFSSEAAFTLYVEKTAEQCVFWTDYNQCHNTLLNTTKPPEHVSGFYSAPQQGEIKMACQRQSESASYRYPELHSH